jgi:anti-anti-sigma regulatory factor
VIVRIDIVCEADTTIVRVGGRLSGESVEELMKHCRSIRPDFVLDLSELRSADDAGVIAIQSLVRGGARVRGDSPFIRMLVSDG